MSILLHIGQARVWWEVGITTRTWYLIINRIRIFPPHNLHYILLLSLVIDLLIRSAEQQKHLLCFCSNGMICDPRTIPLSWWTCSVVISVFILWFSLPFSIPSKISCIFSLIYLFYFFPVCLSHSHILFVVRSMLFHQGHSKISICLL